jgi:hypothetical protein
VLSSPTSLPLNANHLASCKTQKYAASSVWMYILVNPYLNTKFIVLYVSNMPITCQIAYSAWLAIVFHLMVNKLSQLCLCQLIVPHSLALKVCRSAVDSWNCWRTALLSQLRQQEGVFMHYHIFCIWPFFLLLWISYWTSGAQLFLCWMIVPCCSALKVCRSAVDSWNHWRTALLLWLRWLEGAFTHYHIFCGWSFFLLL